MLDSPVKRDTSKQHDENVVYIVTRDPFDESQFRPQKFSDKFSASIFGQIPFHNKHVNMFI
jgi:hypothetical protein